MMVDVVDFESLPLAAAVGQLHDSNQPMDAAASTTAPLSKRVLPPQLQLLQRAPPLPPQLQPLQRALLRRATRRGLQAA
jgi:hypothetical protein